MQVGDVVARVLILTGSRHINYLLMHIKKIVWVIRVNDDNILEYWWGESPNYDKQFQP